MSSIRIIVEDITKIDNDCIVNAANEGLHAGGGVCGAIFAEAGYDKLSDACRRIRHCDTGNAVITPGFDLPAKFIVHAVGPRYYDGTRNERTLLFNTYMNALKRMKEVGGHSITFPLISAGIYGYPKEEAWEVALEACNAFLFGQEYYDVDITFAVIDAAMKTLGDSVLSKVQLMNINELKNILKEHFSKDASGHDYWHTMRVHRLAMKIAETEVCDESLVMWGSLLHDVDDDKLFKSENYQNARSIMSQFSIKPDVQEKVIEIIKSVSFVGTDSVVPSTVEGKIVQDADRLDAIGAIGVARTFAYGGSRGRAMHIPGLKPLLDMDKATYKKHEGTVINHFYEKLFLLKDMMNTDTAKELAKQRHAYMEQFVEEFFEEWEGNR